MKTKMKLMTTLLAVSFATQTKSHGALLAYDPFNQAVGALEGSSSSGGGAVWATTSANWTGDAGNLSQVTAGSLSYGSLATEGNKASLDDRNGANFRALGQTLGGDASDLWMSFLVVATADNTGLNLQTPIGQERVFTGASAGSGQSIGLQGPNIVSGVAQSTTTRMVVFNMNMTGANDLYTIWVDPEFSSLGTGSAPTGALFSGSDTRGDFDFDTIRLGDFNTVSTASTFDEIRIGTTWQDVSPVVPEPSAMLLTALGALGLSFRRTK